MVLWSGARDAVYKRENPNPKKTEHAVLKKACFS